MNKVLTVSCVGLGHRANAYLSIMKTMPEKYKIVALCDIDKYKLELAKKEFNISNENSFDNDEEFFKVRRSDILLICTRDKEHFEPAINALKLGYDILLEKPVSSVPSEINELLETQKKYGNKVFVCHVLRFAPAFLKAKEYISNGDIGKLVSIDGEEKLSYPFYMNSYVRGNYGNSKLSSPAILAKCCHDMDLLTWYADSKCKNVSSLGELNLCKKENQPKEASDRCSTCKLKDTCPYSAYRFYLNNGPLMWARPWVTDVRPITDEEVIKGIETGKYGRCVYACDNDVVDNQSVLINFNNGVKATFRMIGLCNDGGRVYKFYGTKGEVEVNETLGYIKLTRFSDPNHPEKHEISSLVNAAEGHGGGDKGLITNLYDQVTNPNYQNTTSLEYSLESHKICFAAEESRLNNGETINIK